MKKDTNLFYKITDLENLVCAYFKARRGKMLKSDCYQFSKNAFDNIKDLKSKLENFSYFPGEFYQFVIHDPKERVISAAPFCDRVVHHAIMNVTEGVFDREQIFHSYASRKGKGTHRAIYTLHKKMCCVKYYLKIDVRKYFDSINHSILKSKLCSLFSDKLLLDLFNKIIESYKLGDDIGIPIGNLTSQFFANSYLSPLDHYVLENLNVFFYIRYMDDIIILSDSFKRLFWAYNRIVDFLKNKLKLFLKYPIFNKCSSGIAFLGYLIKPDSIKILSKNSNRKLKKISTLDMIYKAGCITEDEAYRRYSSFMLYRIIEK